MTGVQLDLSGVSAGRVWGNADELTSVIRNLLDNAARYAESTVSVSVQESGPWVVIAVEDDGPGIAPEILATLFNSFVSSKPGGMGIGLSVSRTIVEAHGGGIAAENRPEGGAAFHLRLPRATEIVTVPVWIR